VVSPIALTTTQTSCPAALVRITRSATFWILPTSATELPPYFCTTIAIDALVLETLAPSIPFRGAWYAFHRVPSLLALFGPKRGVRLEVAGPLVVGRSSSVELQLIDDKVSREHCRFTPKDGAVIVEDLGSN